MKREYEEKLYLKLFKKDIQKASWFKTLATKHRGFENVIPRIRFLKRYCGYDKLNEEDQESLDRRFRRFYSEDIPVVSSFIGIFWPCVKSDFDPIYQDFVKKTIAMRTRWKYLSDEHRDLLEPEQMELPLIEEAG